MELCGKPKKIRIQEVWAISGWPMNRNKIISRIIFAQISEARVKERSAMTSQAYKACVNCKNLYGKFTCDIGFLAAHGFHTHDIFLFLAPCESIAEKRLFPSFSVKAFLFTLFPHHLVEPSPAVHPRRYFPHETLFEIVFQKFLSPVFWAHHFPTSF